MTKTKSFWNASFQNLKPKLSTNLDKKESKSGSNFSLTSRDVPKLRIWYLNLTLSAQNHFQVLLRNGTSSLSTLLQIFHLRVGYSSAMTSEEGIFKTQTISSTTTLWVIVSFRCTDASFSTTFHIIRLLFPRLTGEESAESTMSNVWELSSYKVTNYLLLNT